MRCVYDNFVIVTGGPGSGKTTLITGLQVRGFAASVEAGRAVIQHQQAIDGPALPWKDPALFAELMLSWELRSYEMAKFETETVFFDRGIPDIVGYLHLTGLPVPDHVKEAAGIFRYNPLVFILPPWIEIFENDAERRQSFEEAERTYRAMVEAYGKCGYELIDVPRASPSDRAGFILKTLGIEAR